ncbi:MAG: permease prefix domain 1-containing protein [Gemmatimonadota bacterium]|nr:permease prefix domain 1-containing protein [Gemmatimonadota bacterium]
MIRDLLRALGKRLHALVRWGNTDQEMSDEIRFHLEMATRKLEASGLTPVEAARQAGRDLRLTFRGLRRTPGFALVAILTLALGIGAATTIFALVDATLLRRLPFPEPARLVHIWETNPDGADFSTSEPNYLDFRDHNTTLEALGGYRAEQWSLTGRGEPRALSGVAATASLFAALRVAPKPGSRWASTPPTIATTTGSG